MENKKKIAIGFDLGTTSVGWSILKINSKNEDNENLEILDMGVRTFDDPTKSKTNIENRREARGRRRRINRAKIRQKDLVNLLIKHKIVSDKNEFENIVRSNFYDQNEERFLLPVEIKIKGIKNKELSKHEIVTILSNWLKHRGVLNTIDNLDDEEEKNIEQLENDYNRELLPCENQFNWFKITGKIIGNNQNSVIKNQQYIEEIKIILDGQELIKTNDFIDEYISIFKRHRHYSQGPGSENSPTKYGLWRLDESNKITKVGENLWDVLIGKCTYYDEVRNYRKSPITEYFNLMNDFANIKIRDENSTGDRYLTFEEKIETLKQAEKLTLNEFLKNINFKVGDIVSGTKKDSKQKPVIEEMKSTKGISKWLIENKLREKIDFSDINEIIFIDDIFAIGVSKQNVEERKLALIENKNNLFKDIDVSDEQLYELSKIKIWNSGTSSISKKAQLEFINFAFTKDGEGKNQMNYFQEIKKIKKDNLGFKKLKYFPNNLFKDEIMSSTVKRTFNQSIKVLNSILKNKKYSDYEISHIFVELAREMNSEEEKNKINRELEQNKKYLEQKLKEHDLTEDDIKGKDKRLKFLLWIEQNKLDIYDGKEINLKDLLVNHNDYHIDHVLPISLSLNDSMANKVLTKALNNENKKDKTPYQWLSSMGKYEEYKQRCLNLLNEVQDKKMKARLQNKITNYLLFEKDIDEEFVGFVSRQLNDTRYISTLFSNQLKQFFRTSKYWSDKNIIIRPINGSLTSYARNNWFDESDCEWKFLPKNRDIYSHHAIDASIIAFLGLNHNIKNLLKFKEQVIKFNKSDGTWIDWETGEILHNRSDFFKEQSKSSKYFRDQMREFLDNSNNKKFVRFSRMVVKKSNLALSNETLYSMRNIDGKLIKVSKINILDPLNTEKLSKLFGDKAVEKEKEKLAIYKRDSKLYEILNKIYLENVTTNNKVNPFHLYLQNEYVLSKIKDADKLDKIPIFISDTNINWVRNLKVFENEIKDIEGILTLEKHNNRAFYDSLKPKSIRVYRDRKGKYKTIFINALNLKWDAKNQQLIEDEEKINKQLEKNDIELNSRFLHFENGKTLIINNELIYVVGGDRNQNKLEIKILSMKNILAYKFSNWKEAPKRDQWQIPVSTIAKNFKLCKVDPLGNVYDIFSFDEYFENNLLKY